MADLGRRITRELTIRYVAVLVALGGLALVGFLGLMRFINDSQGSAALVNVAGSQRMLVERSALAAVGLTTAAAERRTAYAGLLREALDRLDANRRGLIQGLPGRERRRPPSDAVAAMLFGPDGHVDRDLKEFLAHGRVIVAAAATVRPDDDDVAALSAAAEGPLLAGLDEVTARYQQDAENASRQLVAVHAASLVVAVLLLLVSGLGVFQPMVQRIGADIDERIRVEKDLRDSEDRLWRLLEESPVGVSVSLRSDGRVVFANSRFTDLLGMSPDEFIGSNARDHYVDDAQRRQVLGALKRSGSIDDAEVEFRKRDGSPFWSLLTIRPTHFEGEPANLAWIYDITERKAAEEKILLAAKVLETVSDGVIITNAANRIVFVNPAFTAITEYGAGEVVGKDPRILRSGRHDAEFYADMWSTLRTSGHWRGEIWNRRKSGEFFAEWLSMTVIRDHNDHITHHVAVFSDITHRKEDEERVWRQANYDALTGLPNRSLFLDRLSQAVRQARRDGKKFALMFIDLDGFKLVNDSFGHAAGDLLLQQAAARLAECMRSSDTVARLAGDEFTIILQGIQGIDDTAGVAAKIIESLSQPFDLDGGRSARVHGSLGIALFPDDAEEGPALIKLADSAMYAVKRHGKNAYRFSTKVEAD